MNKKWIAALLTIASVILIVYLTTSWNEDIPIQLSEDYPIDLNIVRSNKLFNLTLNYELKAHVCDSIKELLAVILVTSYFGDIETRSAMRRAFSNDELREMRVCRVFLLGKGDGDKFTKQAAVENEFDRFGDLLQGSFHEAYRNLTYKHLMGLKWAAEEFKRAKYIVKMDDDIVIDVVEVVKYLKGAALPGNLLAGYVLRNMEAKREKANKWFVTYDEYKWGKYPVFLSGWFYITNPLTAEKLVALSKYRRYFWIDDTYITGILAQLIHIKHYALNDKFSVHSEYLRCCMNDVEQYNYKCDFFAGPNGGDNNLFYTFNRIIAKCNQLTCVKRPKPINETCVAERKINLGRGSSVIETYKL